MNTMLFSAVKAATMFILSEVIGILGAAPAALSVPLSAETWLVAGMVIGLGIAILAAGKLHLTRELQSFLTMLFAVVSVLSAGLALSGKAHPLAPASRFLTGSSSSFPSTVPNSKRAYVLIRRKSAPHPGRSFFHLSGSSYRTIRHPL